MFSKIAIAASLASVALAMPAQQTAETSTFSLIAIHSGDINVHLRPIVANSRGFWLGRNTTSYCPESVSGLDCADYPGNRTVVGASCEPSGLFMAASVPGGQQAYVNPSGSLTYTQAHSSSKPDGAVVTGFSYQKAAQKGSVGTLTGPGSGFYACPNGQEGEYQIFVGIGDLEYPNCVAIGAAGEEQVTSNTWQYT